MRGKARKKLAAGLAGAAILLAGAGTAQAAPEAPAAPAAPGHACVHDVRHHAHHAAAFITWTIRIKKDGNPCGQGIRARALFNVGIFSTSYKWEHGKVITRPGQSSTARYGWTALHLVAGGYQVRVDRRPPLTTRWVWHQVWHD
jgi:hypothetical protein